MSSYGIKISKPGFPVATATAANLIFSSAWFLFKQVATGSGSISVPGIGEANYTIDTHSLGFTPTVLLYYSLDDVNYQLTGNEKAAGPLFGTNVVVYPYTTGSTVGAAVGSWVAGPFTVYFRYFLYADPAL